MPVALKLSDVMPAPVSKYKLAVAVPLFCAQLPTYDSPVVGEVKQPSPQASPRLKPPWYRLPSGHVLVPSPSISPSTNFPSNVLPPSTTKTPCPFFRPLVHPPSNLFCDRAGYCYRDAGRKWIQTPHQVRRNYFEKIIMTTAVDVKATN